MWSILVSILILIDYQIFSSAQFHRACETFEDCIFFNETLNFKSPYNDPSVALVCDKNKGTCACLSAVSLGQRPLWDLEWVPIEIQSQNTKSNQNGRGICQIGSNGPCGLHDGLRIECAQGNKCLGGRCRQEDKIGKLTLGSLCQNSIECETGLVCKMSNWNYHYTESQCVQGSDDPEEGSQQFSHPLF